jgi:uncharacterized delta-60 repeat protein
MLTAVAALAFTAVPAAQAEPGALDPTFGSGGLVLADPGSISFQGLAVQPDGKVLALDTGNDSHSYQRVLRFLPDGTPDPSFGTGGAVEPVASPEFWTRELALQPDGKILIAGYDSTNDYVVARLMPDGKLDPGFDGDTGTGNGIVHTLVTPGNDMPYAVQVDKQGRIVVAGNAGGGDVGIVRYLPDGTLDKSLAGSGILVDSTPAIETVAALATVDDGILVAGAVGKTTLVARYTDTGAVASGFGQSGRRVLDADPVNSDAASSMAVQSDGTIVVGIGTWNPSISTLDRLVALTPGGELDTSFADGGNTVLPITVNAIALTGGDKIVPAGWSILNDDDAFAVQRLNADGTPDASFAGGAPVLTRPPGSYAIADEVAVAPDGKLVLAGYSHNSELNEDSFAMARYQVDPDPQPVPAAGEPGAGTPPGTTTPQAGPLAVSHLALTHRTFSVGRKHGTAFTFTLNRAAKVTIRVKRLHHARKGVKLTRASRAGRNRVRFTGRVGRRTLGPGRYRATLTATDAIGIRSEARTIAFRVVRA